MRRLIRSESTARVELAEAAAALERARVIEQAQARQSEQLAKVRARRKRPFWGPLIRLGLLLAAVTYVLGLVFKTVLPAVLS